MCTRLNCEVTASSDSYAAAVDLATGFRVWLTGWLTEVWIDSCRSKVVSMMLMIKFDL